MCEEINPREKNRENPQKGPQENPEKPSMKDEVGHASRQIDNKRVVTSARESHVSSAKRSPAGWGDPSPDPHLFRSTSFFQNISYRIIVC